MAGMADDDFDPIDTVVRDVLASDQSSARRLAAQALAERPSVRRWMLPALIAFMGFVAAAVGVTRYATSEPPIVIRGEGDTIVIETGSGRNKTTEVMHPDAPRGGVIIIREGGDS
jgi:hypothetical protein